MKAPWTRWEKWEDAVILNSLTIAEARRQLPHRTAKSVEQRAVRLHWSLSKRQDRPPLTDDQISFLRILKSIPSEGASNVGNILECLSQIDWRAYSESLLHGKQNAYLEANIVASGKIGVKRPWVGIEKEGM